MQEKDDKIVGADAVAIPENDSTTALKEVSEKPVSAWNVLVQGVALFSDGYNVQIIGYMETVMAKL